MAVLDNTLGAQLIAVIVAGILYGFTCVQTWYYFTQYPKDAWYLKLLVTAVLVLDSCHQALITHMIYTYLVTYFGDWAELDNVVWSLVVEVFFNAFTTLFVQCFLAMRVFRLSNKNWLATGIVMIFVLAEFLSAFIFTVQALMPLNTFETFAKLNGLSMTINALSAVGDLIIAGFLCYLLQSSRTGFQKSDTVISKLIVFSVNTGLLTSLCALASLISISVWPTAKIYIGFYYCIGRLYCNSLLATLNARKRLRGGSDEEDMSLSMNTHGTQQKTNHSMIGTSSRVDFLQDNVQHGLITRQRMPNNISIKIDTTQEYIRDEFSSNGDLKDPEAV